MKFQDYPTEVDRGVRGRICWGQPLQRIQVMAAGVVQVQHWPREMAPLPCWRCYQNLEGQARVRVAGQKLVLDSDHVVVIAPGHTIHAQHARPFRQVFAHVWQPRRPARGVGAWRLPADTIDRALAEDLSACFAQPEADRTALVAATAAWSLRILARLPHSEATECYAPAVQRAIDHLLDNRHRPVTSQELAGLVTMHPASFTRLFRQQVGEAPQRWHHRMRLDAACLMLLHPDAVIEAVALDHGYHDRHHFTRVFTRHFGMAPAAWRKQQA